MVRRLPISLALIVLCTSCNTFARVVDSSDADSEDMNVADTDPPDVENNNVSNNLNNRRDMSGPDLDIPDMRDMPDMSDERDMADMADMADMGDLPDMSPYVWNGQPDPPLMLQSDTCSAPSAHGALSPSNWLSGDFAEDIDFIQLGNGQPSAQLAWVDNGVARMAPVAPGDNAVGVIADLPNFSSLDVTDVVLGTRDDPSTFFWIATTGICTNETLAAIQDDMNSLSIGCPPINERPIRIEAMEAAGGFDPYFGAPSLGPAAVWQEVLGQPTPKLIASGGGFGEESAINAEWLNPRMSNNFSIGTTGALAFFPDANNALHSWNITNASLPDTPGGLPFETDITARRGEIDIVKIDARRYVVATVVGNAIELAAYDHPNDGSSTFNRIGRWYAIVDLHNPTAVELATFQGGFVLWYEQTNVPDNHPMGPQGWWVHPFEVAGDRLTAYECAYVHRYQPLTTRDNDLLAWRVGDDLSVLGAVNFRYNNTQYINVEGPTFSGLFQ